jgi:cysteinyl-tRNA synthetase
MTPQEMENAIAFITERQVKFEENQVKFEENQVKFEENFARAEKRFARAEKRLDRLEELVKRLARAADERMKQFEARTAVLQEIMIDVARSQKSVLEALRRYSGNGRKRAQG